MQHVGEAPSPRRSPLVDRLAAGAWALLQAGVPLSLLLDLASPDGPRSEAISLAERPPVAVAT